MCSCSNLFFVALKIEKNMGIKFLNILYKNLQPLIRSSVNLF